ILLSDIAAAAPELQNIPRNASQAESPGNTGSNVVHGWVSSDGGRGTSDILWSCLVTIFACTYTVLHANIMTKRVSAWRSTITKFVMMISIMLTPEGLVLTAVLNKSWASRGTKELRRLGISNCTVTHGFFLVMGGFRLKSPSGQSFKLYPDHIRYVADVSNISKASTAGSVASDNVSKKEIALIVREVQLDMKVSWIRALRKITEDDINDLAKTNDFAKLFACVQTSWFMAQVIARGVQELAITALEISTVAFVVFALLSYGMWWKKPQECCGPIILECTTEEEYSFVQDLEKVHKLPSIQLEREAFGLSIRTFHSLVERANMALEQWWLRQSIRLEIVTGSALIIGASLLFGSIHCAAWNFQLPTHLELWFWRSSAIAISALPCLAILSACLFCFSRSPKDAHSSKRLQVHLPQNVFFYAWILFLFILYCVARFYLVVEMFLSLRAGPASAYANVNWLNHVPHV
ncbi:hypothetical protein MMC06_005411, partial [Schaereria dolodes]|nr:hypothetical protein [Schaereria dolodes]